MDSAESTLMGMSFANDIAMVDEIRCGVNAICKN